MRKPDLVYRKLVLVCLNEREQGAGCCRTKGSETIYQKLKQQIREQDHTVRVSRTGCLGNCLSGVSVVIMPDNIWLGDVQERDIPEIVTLVLNS